MVAHHLALSAEKGEVPPLGLLQVAETIGGADWQPARMNFSETIAELIAQVPKRCASPLRSHPFFSTAINWPTWRPIAQSWFEDDPEIAQAV